MKFNNETIASIVLHVVCISVFIGIFFFTYAAKVEGQIVEKQVEIIVNDFTGDVSAMIPTDTMNDFKPLIISSLTITPEQQADFDRIDKEAAEHNDQLKKKAITVLGVLFIIGILIVLYLRIRYKDFNLLHLIVTTCIAVVFVGLTELLFLVGIAKNYRTADSNFVKKVIVENIKNFNSKHVD